MACSAASPARRAGPGGDVPGCGSVDAPAGSAQARTKASNPAGSVPSRKRDLSETTENVCGTSGGPVDEGAGGSYRREGTDEVVEMDALEFCRVLSGRAEAAGVLTHRLPL